MKHTRTVTHVLTVAIAGAASASLLAAQAQAPRVPQPFPGAVSKPAAEAQAAAAQQPAEVTPPPINVPVYPTAELIGSYDAGRGQRYYLYGTNAAYADIVAYYKNVLKNGGREIYKSPGMQQFDLGRYQEDQMAYPPSVVVKDYAADNAPGYLAVNGTKEKRFRTVIQIVPAR